VNLVRRSPDVPGMTKLKDFKGHTVCVLHMAASPGGATVVTAAADVRPPQMLRFCRPFSVYN
jgi:hypothetical protein